MNNAISVTLQIKVSQIKPWKHQIIFCLNRETNHLTPTVNYGHVCAMERRVCKAELTLFVAILFGSIGFSWPNPNHCKADKHTNGCSVPLGMNAPFKDDFKPACNKHDICYGCVSLF